ncbi:hypothetical protein JOD45_001286 [Scopulibacillus daqui]|uniref:Uncharacterized protein n=1 Tax=Scopulibacillus daqui TaxID=1469162 RepID=A0ABS2PZT0_9BACL|nr:hypothetical protein [Scopulibacillus daqui]
MKNLIWKYILLYIIGSILLGVVVFFLGYIVPLQYQSLVRFIFSATWLIIVTVLYIKERKKQE